MRASDPLIGQTVTIKPGWGYTMLDPITFRRAGNDTSGVVYAVQGTMVYLRFPNGTTARVAFDAIEEQAD